MSVQIKGTGNSVLPGADLGTPLAEARGGTGVSTVLAATKTALNASGSAPVYACRAWCTFNGSTAGTNAPTSGGNVTSVTKNSTGNWSINLTTAMSDALYAVEGTCSRSGGGNVFLGTSTVSTVNINMYNPAGSAVDADQINIAIFR